MVDPKLNKLKIAHFGRTLAALFNRPTMYHATHPYTRQSIDSVYMTIKPLLTSISPLVFNMNHEKLFIDENPLDLRINVSRVVEAFKSLGIQSISFYQGLDKNELRAFIDMFSSPEKYPNAEAMKRALTKKGISRLKINHVLFKKVTEDDQVVSGNALEKVMPPMGEDERQHRSKKLFIDTLLESVLADEFVKDISIKAIVENPTLISKDMIEADLSNFRESGSKGRRPGSILMQQLHFIDKEVEKNLSGVETGEVNLSDLASAVLEMKKQLIEGIESQKTLGIAYSHEELILDKAHEITDKVLIQLVRDEYKPGEISVARMAQILRRLIPEADELKRLLPKIKSALLEEGMTLSEYLYLVQELGSELQSEGLATILKVSSDDIGIDGDELVEEVKRNPEQAAELIYLAAEIQKETDDENALTNVLVDYIEKLGSTMAMDVAKEDGVKGKHQLREAVTGIESQIVRKLKKMDMKDDVLHRLEERLNQRVDEVLDKIRTDWIHSQSSPPEEASTGNLSLLQRMELSVSENDELGEILKIVHSKAESDGLDENDFKQIYTEIAKEKQKRRQQEAQKKMPPGIFKAGNLMFFMRREIVRSRRYDTPFAALAFSIVKAKPRTRTISKTITHQAMTDAILRSLSDILRDTDIIGQLGKNKIVALLPMTGARETKLALRRSMKILNSKPIDVNGTPLDFKIAGVFTVFNPIRTPDADEFVKTLSMELLDMITRNKHIDIYY